MVQSVISLEPTINLYGTEYGQPGALKKLGKFGQVTHTMLKLKDNPQPKVQIQSPN